ncbi:MAG: hypothetical protein ACW9W3_06355 [Candidatus Nitrosopumilus sp. bin_68KS]
MKYFVIFLVMSCVILGLATPAHAEEQKQFHEGSVEWISKCFMVGSDAVLRVTDPDMNRDSELVEEITVMMWSDNDYRNVVYVLTETGKDTGIFDANVFFTTTDSSPGKRLRIVDGSTIYAKYVDYTSSKSYNAVDVINSVVTGLSVLERNTDGRISKITYDPCALELLTQNPDRFEQIDVFYPPPLKQFKSGIPLYEIKCKETLLLIKKYDGTPKCVTPETREKLKERGWDAPLLVAVTRGAPIVLPEPPLISDFQTQYEIAKQIYTSIPKNADSPYLGMTYGEDKKSILFGMDIAKLTVEKNQDYYEKLFENYFAELTIPYEIRFQENLGGDE